MKKFNLIDKCNNDFNLNNGLLDIYLKNYQKRKVIIRKCANEIF